MDLNSLLFFLVNFNGLHGTTCVEIQGKSLNYIHLYIRSRDGYLRLLLRFHAVQEKVAADRLS